MSTPAALLHPSPRCTLINPLTDLGGVDSRPRLWWVGYRYGPFQATDASNPCRSAPAPPVRCLWPLPTPCPHTRPHSFLRPLADDARLHAIGHVLSHCRTLGGAGEIRTLYDTLRSRRMKGVGPLTSRALGRCAVSRPGGEPPRGVRFSAHLPQARKAYPARRAKSATPGAGGGALPKLKGSGRGQSHPRPCPGGPDLTLGGVTGLRATRRASGAT